MADWKPPKVGSPVWLGISANDISRAEKFYATVFNWSFKDDPAAKARPEHPKTRLVDFNPDVSLTGGLQHQPEKAKTGTPPAGPGGTCVYWLVEDLNKTVAVIETAGGKMIGSKEPIKEGESAQAGVYRYFEDTEGNVGGVYQLIGT